MFVLLNHVLNNMTQKEDLQKNERSCNDYFRIHGLFFFCVLISGAIILAFLHIYLNVFYVRTAFDLAGSKSKEIFRISHDKMQQQKDG